MAQKAPDEAGDLVLAHGQTDQAVVRMTEITTVEIQIASKKGYWTKPMKKRDNLLVNHSAATDLTTDLTDPNPPAVQKVALVVRNVFIKNIHNAVI